MTNTDYRIGIIGIGAIADHHAKAISDIENATVVAGSSRTESSTASGTPTTKVCSTRPPRTS